MTRHKSESSETMPGGARPGKAKPLEAVAQLHGLLRDARSRLTAPTPENLEECQRRLEQAADMLRRVQTTTPSGDRQRDLAVRSRLQGLRAEISRVAVLLDGAAAFHAGWMQLAASMATGYTADGTPAAPETGRRLWMEV